MIRLPLSDQRLTAIATSSLDLEVVDLVKGGVSVPVVATPVLDNAPDGFSLRREGAKAWFTIGYVRKTEPVEVSVHIDNEELVFFPKRSAAHREILRALGEGE